MKTTYAKINAYDGAGEYRIICNDAEQYNRFSVVHIFYDYAENRTRSKTLAKYADLKSALIYVAQLVPNAYIKEGR